MDVANILRKLALCNLFPCRVHFLRNAPGLVHELGEIAHCPFSGNQIYATTSLVGGG